LSLDATGTSVFRISSSLGFFSIIRRKFFRSLKISQKLAESENRKTDKVPKKKKKKKKRTRLKSSNNVSLKFALMELRISLVPHSSRA
jgi:hypothetical protein